MRRQYQALFPKQGDGPPLHRLNPRSRSPRSRDDRGTVPLQAVGSGAGGCEKGGSSMASVGGNRSDSNNAKNDYEDDNNDKDDKNTNNNNNDDGNNNINHINSSNRRALIIDDWNNHPDSPNCPELQREPLPMDLSFLDEPDIFPPMEELMSPLPLGAQPATAAAASLASGAGGSAANPGYHGQKQQPRHQQRDLDAPAVMGDVLETETPDPALGPSGAFSSVEANAPPSAPRHEPAADSVPVPSLQEMVEMIESRAVVELRSYLSCACMRTMFA